MNVAVASLTALALSAAAQAQYSTDFEAPAYTGSAGGTLTTGQNGWYLPVAGSVDHHIYTYAGNSLGVANNPNGGAQFDAGVSSGTAAARAQHNANFSAGGAWTASWDCLGLYNGTLPAADNLGSFSLQPSTASDYFQQIMQWGTNTAAAQQYNINYGVFTAAGGPGGAGIAFNSPGAAWTSLPANHWIHQSTTWSFTSGQILSVSIQDITAGGATTTVDTSAMGWYLSGGANNVLGQALPTDIRVFAGGSAGNVSAWDNINVNAVPSPGVLALLGLGGLAARRRRR